jgi:hypothetical protein
MNKSLTIFAAFFALVAFASGCAASTDESDVATESSAYRSFRPLGSDTYTCTMTDGRHTTTATLTRSLSERIAQPNDRIFSQSLQLGEPVFTAAVKSLGAYGCWHRANDGWEVSDRTEKFPGRALDPRVDFRVSQDEQWSNCDYNAHESASVTEEDDGLHATFELRRDDNRRSIRFTGTCEKN